MDLNGHSSFISGPTSTVTDGSSRANALTNGLTNGLANGLTNGTSDGHSNGVLSPMTSDQHLIAICGMAMRLPGGIHDAQAFWDLLYNGKDMRTLIPADRYNAKAFSNTLGKKGAIKTQYGYFLSDDLSSFDASFFSMTKSDLEKTDPQQRQILEVTRECFENAGEVNYRGKKIGCYVGTFGEDWLHLHSKENQFTGTFSGSGDLMIANRVSYEFDFRGPRYQLTHYTKRITAMADNALVWSLRLDAPPLLLGFIMPAVLSRTVTVPLPLWLELV